MNKSDLAKTLGKIYDFPLRKASHIVDTVFGLMNMTLASGERIEIRGFGTFTVRDYKGHTRRNPRSGVRIAVKAKKLPFFRAGKEFKERLNKK